MAKLVMHTAAYEKEEEKLETYHKLASSLNDVAPAAVEVIAPALKLAIATHEQQHEKVQHDHSRLTHAWKDALALFVARATETVETAADSAATRLRNETDTQMERIKAEVAVQLRRIARTTQSEPTLNSHASKTSQYDEGGLRKRKYDAERHWQERQHESPDVRHEPASKRLKYEDYAGSAGRSPPCRRTT
ncbi:unnamed protein product [Peniophora sp. CBMAI 1063]|nr:unnamed protein product [Peniophora sp. CBMAI 1063]